MICRHALIVLVIAMAARGHDVTPVTHTFDSGTPQPGPRLVLSITERSTGRSLPARFSILVDGNEYEPAWIDGHGIRFRSIHRTKHQEFTAVYARGTGPVTVALPAGARDIAVTASRGFEYLPARAAGRVENDRVALELPMSPWIDLESRGWIAVDEHLHYDRLDPAADGNWLTMLEADGLAAGHFLVLKGGMMPGVWAQQFAYGPKGQATDEHRIIVPGQEYRDGAQGHVNLLGVNEVIEPISTGGMTATPAENFPPFHDVLLKARGAGGFNGVAHGGTLGRTPTAVADAILGAVDFWELSNGFIHSTELWYRLMNCGYFLPPAAGTDLPNSPFRDPWQPLLGAVRTYVNTGGRIDFMSFKAAMAEGRVFITGGPIIEFTVDGKGPGETVQLPAGGGSVVVRAVLESPLPLQRLQLIHNGRPIDATVIQAADGPVHRWRFEHRLAVNESGWIAAAGIGASIKSQGFDAMAHTGVVRVLVNNRPVRLKEDLGYLLGLLDERREIYRTKGRYLAESDRARALMLFDRARDNLRERMEAAGRESPAGSSH